MFRVQGSELKIPGLVPADSGTGGCLYLYKEYGIIILAINSKPLNPKSPGSDVKVVHSFKVGLFRDSVSGLKVHIIL